jgi:hypothetical protein
MSQISLRINPPFKHNQGVTPLASLASFTRGTRGKPPHFTAAIKKLERNPDDMHAASHLYGIITLVSLHQWLLVHVISSLLEGRLENVLLIFSFKGLTYIWQLSVLQRSNRWSDLTPHLLKRRPYEDTGDAVEYLVLPLTYEVTYVQVYRRQMGKDVDVYDMRAA